MPVAFPWFVKGAIVLQPELVADRQSDFPALQLGQTKPRHALLIKAEVPTDGDVGLGL